MEEGLASIAVKGPKCRILVVVDADPRTDGRVAEAVRMAGGVGVWGQVEFHVVLRGAAARAVGAGAADFPKGKMYGQFIGMIREKGGKVWVMPDAEAMEVVDVDEMVNHSLKEPDFNAMTTEFSSVMRF
jgi:hypothetical protein